MCADLTFRHLEDAAVRLSERGRKRGTHSTLCKCPAPFYTRPTDQRNLPGELGHALRNLVKKDKVTGQFVFRRRVSRDPYFVFLRAAVGRERGFRPERRNLIDALFVVLVDTADLATGIVTVNLSRLARRLSPHDADGNCIPETEVTLTRVSRLIEELIRYGVLEVPAGEKFDRANLKYFPKHVIISDAGWRLTGINLDKLRQQQQERLTAEADGLLAPNEEISVRAARKRWYERCRHATLLRRRTEALQSKRAKQLKAMDLDDQKYLVANRLIHELPEDYIRSMSEKDFDKMVWNELYQLKLMEAPPDTEPRH
ncbi:TPA: replication initiator protein RepA [Salmonella enterica subsp. salamae serovar 35:g,m,s,t:-]|nr:replication initiator protein RepA [Salmonella enterica subsp. salamae serovar 35:g,m,s,t:-]HCA3549723.1 replication initiator protein RepA [Salmonella enterica subsp. salamae serovar 35:g,m,s,t:-]